MFQDCVGVGSRGDAKRGNRLQIRKGFHDHQTTTIAKDDVCSFSIERRDDVMRFIIDRHHGVLTCLVDHYRWMFQWTDQKIRGIAWMKLNFQDW